MEPVGYIMFSVLVFYSIGSIKLACIMNKRRNLSQVPESISNVLDKYQTVINPIFLDELKQEECCICLTNYDDKSILIKLPCGHKYHRPCIYRWMLQKAECPSCRSNIT